MTYDPASPSFGVASTRQNSSVLPVLFGLTAAGSLLSGVLPLASGGDGKLFDGGAYFVLAILIPAGFLLLAAVSSTATPAMAGLGGGAALAAMSLFGSLALVIWKLTDGEGLGGGTYAMTITAIVAGVAFLASLSAPGVRSASVAHWLAALAGIAMCIGSTLVPSDLGYEGFDGYSYEPSWSDWNYFGEGQDRMLAVSVQLLIWAPVVGLLVGAAKRGRSGALFGLGASSVLGWLIFASSVEIGADSLGELGGLKANLHPLAVVGAVGTFLFVLAALSSSKAAAASSAGATSAVPEFQASLGDSTGVATNESPAVVAPMAARTAANPARWVTDPFGRHESRYWNGRSWTKHVADGGVTGVDRPVAGPEATPATVVSSADAAPSFAPPTVPFSGPLPPTIRHSDPDRTIPRQRATPLMELVFDSGQRVTLVAPVIVGRSPVVQANHPTATLLPFPDDTMSVSATHFAVGVNSGEAWVEDLGSTNGSVVADGHGTSVPLSPGTRAALVVGSSIRFGDRTARLVASSQAQS